ncbi:MAG: ABC transporter permease [Bacteroidia bacterium]
MIRNFFLMAWRHLLRQPGYAMLNLVGLITGITATMFIALYLIHELSYERQHDKADRIFRISSDIAEPDNAFRWSATQVPLGLALARDYPEVEAAVRFIPAGRTRFVREDREFYVEKVFFVDSTVAEVFTFDFLSFDPVAPFAPNKIFLSESVARRLFGDSNPMGQTLRHDQVEQELQVAGVYRDMAPNSHLIAEAMVSTLTLPADAREDNGFNWGNFGIYTYVLLPEGYDPKLFEAKLPEVIEKYVATIFDQFNIKITYVLDPITRIHLHSTRDGEPEPGGDISYIYIFMAVGVFLLLIACINYMNLTTARATRRAREVGIRKVLGSWRGALLWQFLTESLLLTALAVVVSMVLVVLLLPVFNDLLGIQLYASTLAEPPVWLGLLAVTLVVGLFSGSYPAFVLSRYEPAVVFKGGGSPKGSSYTIRISLVFLQFAISLFMVASTGIVFDQLAYIRDKDMGYTDDPVLRVALTEESMRQKWEVLRTELAQSPLVKGTATSSGSPGTGYNKLLFSIENAEGVMEQRGIDNYRMDPDYLPTMDMRIVAGRNFSRDIPTDSTLAVLVNQAMVQRMGWADPIGRKVQLGVGDSTLPTVQVIGVVSDFHQRSLYHPIEPLMFLPGFNNHLAHVRIDPTQVDAALAHVEATWQRIFPTTPFEYEFIDEAFMEQYEKEARSSRLFTLFSSLTILIACLGLIGLAAYSAEQRRKELTIRKISGASTGQLMLLLTRVYFVLIAAASVFAFGGAYFFMRYWLETFDYVMPFRVRTFVAALLLTLVSALLATAIQAYRAAHANPADTLRYE